MNTHLIHFHPKSLKQPRRYYFYHFCKELFRELNHLAEVHTAAKEPELTF